MIEKERLSSVRVISNIKIIKKLSKLLLKVCNKLDLDYNVILEIFNLKSNDTYDKVYLEKVKLWKALSVGEKEIIAKWIDISTEQKREIIKKDVGVTTDEAIDSEVKKYNQMSDYFEHLDLGKLEDCSNYIKDRDNKYSFSVLFNKFASLVLDEYDDELDKYGEIFTELCSILSLATNNQIKVEELLDTSLELIIELLIRIVLKTNNEIEESFFIKKIVNKLVEFTNIQNIIKTES
jgi:hypothetical protein